MNEVSVFGVGTSLSSSAGGANINPDIEAYVSEYYPNYLEWIG